MKTSLRVIVCEHDGHWTAQALEYDIGAQANSLEELARRFHVTIQLDRQYSIDKFGEAFKGIEPAPQFFHDLWETADQNFDPKVDFDGDDVDMHIALAA